jgi:hypothetical protein
MTITTESMGTAGNVQDYGDAHGDIADVAFYVAACQLEALDGELNFDIGQLKVIAEIKKAYRERIAQINDWLADMKDDKVKVPADQARKMSFEGGSVDGDPVAVDEGSLTDSEKYSLVDENGEGVTSDAGVMPDGRVIEPGESPFDLSGPRMPWRPEIAMATSTLPDSIPRWGAKIKGDEAFVREMAQDHPGSVVMVEVSRKELENEVSRLQGRLDDLATDGELQLLAINRLLSRRNQAMQLASNIMSSTHQSAMGIIANIK